MKTYVSRVCVFFGLLVANTARGQEIPEFNKLRTPTSPAFTILGIAPAQIERPTAPAPFAVSLLDQVGQNLSLPSSFALETTPYWWRSHPGLTFDEYQNRGWSESIIQNFAISLAVTDSAPPGRSPSDSAFRRLGLGFRSTLVPGRPVATPPCIAAIDSAAVSVAVGIGRLASRAIAADATLAVDTARLKLLMLQWEREVRADSIIAAAGVPECTKELSARQGFVMDGALALALNHPEGRADAGKLGTVGVWVTPAILRQQWSVAFVARAQWDDMDTDSTTTILDAGARGVFARDKWALSGEAVYRHRDRSEIRDKFVRLSGIFDFQVMDNTWFQVTIGRDFDANEPQSLLAILNLQWNIGERSVVPNPRGNGAGSSPAP